MLSEDIYFLKEKLWKHFDEYSSIYLDAKSSVALLRNLEGITEQVIALENAVVSDPARAQKIVEKDNVVRLDYWKVRKESSS